jgi:SSS family solute:Na+ symporter
MAMLSGMLWFICTAGSDQIAIQRYLATSDVREARKVLGVSLLATAVSLALLALTGLALLAYFRAHPDRLLPGTSVAQDADKLYAHFIVIGFPQGVTGLVIAGLLATAMSSLSSGVNSACSVISVDFLDRFTKDPDAKLDGAARSKLISWIVGVLVVVLSTLIGQIDGNLLEVGYKAVNHLAVPLFLLIFMAILVPWATWLGAVAAVIASVCMSISIAYFEWMDLSFIWIVPAALAAGLAAGMIVSLIPMKIAGNR